QRAQKLQTASLHLHAFEHAIPSAHQRMLSEPVLWKAAMQARPSMSAAPALLLRACSERPRGSGAANERYERAAVHSITSSARASSLGGISMPNAFAVARLMTRSNLVPRSTGRSPGFSPLRIRPT